MTLLGPPEELLDQKKGIKHDQAAILKAVLAGYTLPEEGIHGKRHWARVLRTGLRIAKASGGDPEVVRLFALFHDSRRENEKRDPGHGLRGAEFARSLRGALVHLGDAQFELLHYACAHHTNGTTSTDPTIGACWDADRLDLGRANIRPDPKFMSTEAGRKEGASTATKH